MIEDLIDSSEEQTTDSNILANVKWWERKRIWYNVVLIAIIVASFFFVRYGSYYYRSDRIIGRSIFFGIFLVIANLCYCLGWGIDILLRHYFKTRGFSKGLNIAFFIVGTILMALVMLFFAFIARI